MTPLGENPLRVVAGVLRPHDYSHGLGGVLDTPSRSSLPVSAPLPPLSMPVPEPVPSLLGGSGVGQGRALREVSLPPSLPREKRPKDVDPETPRHHLKSEPARGGRGESLFV